MRPGDLVRVKNGMYYRMFYPELVDRVGVITGVIHFGVDLMFEVLLGGELVDLDPRSLERA
jgi:hypothetical protein